MTPVYFLFIDYFVYFTKIFKTKDPGLLCEVVCVIVRLAVVWYMACIRRIDRRTDGRTDTRPFHIALALRPVVKIKFALSNCVVSF